MSKVWIKFEDEKPENDKFVLVYKISTDRYYISKFVKNSFIRENETEPRNIWIDIDGKKRICHKYDFWCNFEYFKLGENNNWNQ